jgi:hypothetical protein
MNWEMIGAVGEILGALGVLASLIYLGTQIRSNTHSLQAASLQSVLDGPRDNFFKQISTSDETSLIFIKGLKSLDLLEENENLRFWCLMIEHCFQAQQAMQLYERGLLEKVDYEAWVQWAASLLRTPGGAEMWKQISLVITPTIASVINEELDQNPDGPSVIELMPAYKYNG